MIDKLHRPSYLQGLQAFSMVLLVEVHIFPRIFVFTSGHSAREDKLVPAITAGACDVSFLGSAING